MQLRPQMRIACEDLTLEKLWVVYPGKTDYALDEHIEVVSIGSLQRVAEQLTSMRR